MYSIHFAQVDAEKIIAVDLITTRKRTLVGSRFFHLSATQGRTNFKNFVEKGPGDRVYRGTEISVAGSQGVGIGGEGLG
jgi:hypothetical protein